MVDIWRLLMSRRDKKEAGMASIKVNDVWVLNSSMLLL